MSLPMMMKVAAVSGSTKLLHGDGKNFAEMAPGMGQQRLVIAMTIDCAFVDNRVLRDTVKLAAK